MKTVKQLIKDSKHFCVLPWIHFHAWPDKRVLPCCIADSDSPVSEITDEIEIIDLMNSDEFKKMRTAMLNDEPYEACTRCYELEDRGMWTLRNSQNLVRGEDALELIEDTQEDGTIEEFKLLYMDMRFSNLCNFKCRSCGPGCSNLWGDEELKRVGEEHFNTKFGRTNTLVTNNGDGNFMRKLKPYLKDVQECYFAGGEILVTPEHYECLDHWIEQGLQDNVKLNYTTNMSILDYKGKQLFDYWEQFPNVEVWASLDAMGEVAEVVRAGTKWDKVEHNLKQIRDNMPHVNLQITPTISIWNVFEYWKLFDYLYENDLVSKDIAPRVNVLTYPDYANISILPDYIRMRLIKKYKEYVKRYEDNEDMLEIMNGFRIIVQTLYKGNEDKEKLKKFFEDQQTVDRVRNENLLEVIPELVEVYEWTTKN